MFRKTGRQGRHGQPIFVKLFRSGHAAWVHLDGRQPGAAAGDSVEQALPHCVRVSVSFAQTNGRGASGPGSLSGPTRHEPDAAASIAVPRRPRQAQKAARLNPSPRPREEQSLISAIAAGALCMSECIGAGITMDHGITKKWEKVEFGRTPASGLGHPFTNPAERRFRGPARALSTPRTR